MRSVSRLLVLLLLAASLAGCASNDPPADEGDAGAEDDEVAIDEGEPTPEGDEPAKSEEDDSPGGRLGQAFERIDAAPGHYLARIQHYDGSLPRPDMGTDALYVDSANGTTYYRLNGSSDDRVGQVGRVVVQLSSSNATVYSVFDEEIEPFTTVANFSALALGAKLPIPLAYYPPAQYMFLQRAYYVPAFTQPATKDDPGGPGRVEYMWGQPTSTSTRVVMDADLRIHWLNATQAQGGKVVKWGNASFVYGAPAAADPEVAKLRRAASMSFLDKATLDATQMGTSARNQTWTILSDVPALVALGEAELRVFGSGDAGRDTPDLVLRLEEREASNAALAATYADVDGDGKVSRGDTLSVTVKRTGSDLSDYDIRLTDETTGWELTAG